MGNIDIKVDVISASIEVICGGKVPGGRAVAAKEVGVEVGGRFICDVIGAFSLLVSCEDEDIELSGSIGDEGKGDKKLSVGSVSVRVIGGIDDGIVGTIGDDSRGIGNSWRVIFSMRDTIRGNNTGQTA